MAQADFHRGTLTAYPQFNAEEDCQVLRKAMKGLGTDEKAIISVLGYRNSFQRAEINVMFKTMFGKDLSKELKSELSGHFNKLCQGLLLSLTQYDAKELRKAMKGAGTDENALSEIIGSRNNEQLRAIKECYAKMYSGRTLEDDLMSETSGHFKRVLVSLVQANRDETTTVDPQVAQTDARRLYEAGEKKFGTDESVFNQILVMRSEAHLRSVFKEYQRISNKTIEQALQGEFCGDIYECMLTVVRSVINKPAHFAQALYDCMAGAGTTDDTLIRVVVSRCEIDMVQIKEEFVRLFGKTLASFIKGDTSGDYKKLLLALIGDESEWEMAHQDNIG